MQPTHERNFPSPSSGKSGGSSVDSIHHLRTLKCPAREFFIIDEFGQVGGADTVTTSTLVVVCGFPGVGKSTVSAAIVDRLGGTRFRTDVVRNDLFNAPDYTVEEERQVYDEICQRAREALRRHQTVVLDGTFYRQRYRDRASSIAVDAGSDLLIIRVDCDLQTVRDRISSRSDDESDADFRIHKLYRERFEPIERDYELIDNSDEIDETMRQIERLTATLEGTTSAE